MPPMYGYPNYEFSEEDKWEVNDGVEEKPQNLTEMAFWYMIVLIVMLLLWLFMFFCLRIIALRQKTRSPQARIYAGGRGRARARSSLPAQEPTVYVSPDHLPPPPKYECMAPPSYEEVVGIHYPQYSAQPISAPIAAAMAQSSSHNVTNDVTSITVVNEPRRTSVTVART